MHSYMKATLGLILSAFFYYYTAELTQSFSIDPINYLPVWPAAGTALLCVFIWRRWAWFGIFFGSLVSVIQFAITNGDTTAFHTPFLWIGMAALNATQAYICFLMLRPFVNNKESLSKSSSIPLLILKVGIVLPLVIAFSVMLVIHLHGRISLKDIPQVAVIWAIGNSVAILAFIPAMFSMQCSKRSIVLGLRGIAMLSGSYIAVFVLLYLFHLLVHSDIDSARRSLESAGDELVADIKADFLNTQSLLGMTKDVLAISAVTKPEAADYIQITKPIFQHCQGLEYLYLGQTVPNDPPFFSPVIYALPQSKQEELQSMELFSKPVIEKTLVEAVKTGHATLTPPISLHSGKHSAIAKELHMLFQLNPATDGEPGGNSLSHIIGLAFESQKVLQKFWNVDQHQGLHVKLYDVSETEPVYIGGMNKEGHFAPEQDKTYLEDMELNVEELYIHRIGFSVLDRQWELTVVADDNYFKKNTSSAPASASVGGFILILWFCYFVLQNYRSFFSHRSNCGSKDRRTSIG